MSEATQNPEHAVEAVHVTTERQRLAFSVVDAVDDLHERLAALRAVGQLTVNEGTSESLPQLQRADLATLLRVLSSDLEAHCLKARTAAVMAAKAA